MRPWPCPAHPAPPRCPRRPARTDDLAVIPATVVHPLAQKLNGRLGAICLQGRHVQVIDEEDEVAPQGRPEHTLPPVGWGCVSPAPTGTRSSGNPGWQDGSFTSGKPSLTSGSPELLSLLSNSLSHSEHPGTSHLAALSLASRQIDNKPRPSAQPRESTHRRARWEFLMEEGSRAVCKGAQGPPGRGGVTAAGRARLGDIGPRKEPGCLPLIQLAVDEVLGLVG